jgi:hypothetical protein
VLRSAASHARKGTLWRSQIAPTIGVKITLKPVMNAAFDAVVVNIPIVCVAYPAKLSSPNISPGMSVLRSGFTHNKKSAAKLKRTASRMGTGTVWIVSLITAKVLPQITVTSTSSSTPTRGDISGRPLPRPLLPHPFPLRKGGTGSREFPLPF